MPHDVSFSRVSHLDSQCLYAFEAAASSDHFLPELVRPKKMPQNMEPLELAGKIFGKDSMRDIGNYIAGGYKGEPNGKDLQEGAITKFLI